MSNNNTSTIALALVQGTTIKNKTAARVTGDKVGLPTYTAWVNAVNSARLAFYRYQHIKDGNAIREAHGKESVDIEPAKQKAMEALQSILDVVGEVHGYKLRKSDAMLDLLAEKSKKDTDELAGEAMTVGSQVKNYKTQLKNGGNEEFIADIQNKLSEAEVRLSELKKLPGSAKPADGACSEKAFIKGIERKMGEIIAEQYAKTPEQVQKEEDDRKAQKKAKKQAQRQAAAEAKKAEATAK